MSEDHRKSIFQRSSGGSRHRVQNSWHRLTIIYKVTAAVGEDLWYRGVCWGNSVIVSASVKQGSRNLMDFVGALMSVGDIWLGVGSVGTDHGTRAGAAVAGRNN